MSTFTQAEIESSILLSIKKSIVGPPEYTPFDADLIMHINSQIANLYQLGLDSAKSVVVDGADQLWTDLIPAGDSRLQFVRTYVYARVKMIFDPPTSTAQMQALKDAAAEAKATAVKAQEKVVAEVKEVAKTAAKTTTRKTCKTSVCVEMNGLSVAVADIQSAVKAAVKAQGLEASELKIYVNANEQAAYYTVDGQGGESYKIDLKAL